MIVYLLSISYHSRLLMDLPIDWRDDEGGLQEVVAYEQP